MTEEYSLGYVRDLADTNGSLHLIGDQEKKRRAVTFRSLDEAGGLPAFPMTKLRYHLRRFRPHAVLVLDILVIGMASYVAISHLLSDLSLSPDSSSYITAANNLAHTGRLFVFVNSPSRSMLPKVSRYTEQPPGLPAYFVPFMLAFDDPIQAAVIAQAVVIACLFLFLYLLMGRLGLSRPLRAIALVIFLMMDGFRRIYVDPGTEALFICLSVIIGWLAIRYYQGGQERWVWPTLILLIAFSTSVRYTGVANIAWLIPSLFRRRTIAGIPQLIAHRYVVRVFIGGGLALVVLSLLGDALGLGPSKNPGIGPVQTRGIAVGSAAFVIGMILLAIRRRRKLRAGAKRSDSALAPDVYWPIGAAFAAVAPVGLWLLRNQLIVGKPTRTGGFDSFTAENLVVPFEFIGSSLFDLRFVPTTIVALVTGVIVLLPLWLSQTKEKKAHILLAAACAAHFTAVTLASTVVRISAVHFRLLSPMIALGIVIVLSGVQAGIGGKRSRAWRKMLYALPIGYLFLASVISAELLVPGRFAISYPRERQLWMDIRELGILDQSSHFYSDGIFEHQIFAGIPQRIFWDLEMVEEAASVNKLLASGRNPFILFQNWGPEAKALDELIANGSVKLQVVEFPASGFTLYYPPG